MPTVKLKSNHQLLEIVCDTHKVNVQQPYHTPFGTFIIKGSHTCKDKEYSYESKEKFCDV
jgi:hypothetical protein